VQWVEEQRPEQEEMGTADKEETEQLALEQNSTVPPSWGSPSPSPLSSRSTPHSNGASPPNTTGVSSFVKELIKDL